MERKIGFIFCLIFSLVGCTLENAKPLPYQHIVIASDFLKPKDCSIFKAFTKKTNIKVYILSLSAENIINKLKSEKSATRIDAVLLSSLVSMKKIKDEQLIQHSQNELILPIAYNPYVISIFNDTLDTRQTYRGVLNSDNWSSLSKDPSYFTPMLAEANHSLRKNKTHFLKWLNVFIESKSRKDTTVTNTNQISKYADFMKLEFKNRNELKIIFPNEKLYTDVVSFAIIKQARNYTNALHIRQLIQREKINKIIAAKGNFFPISMTKKSKFPYQNRKFDWIFDAPTQLINKFNFVEKSLVKKEKIKANL